MWGCLKALALGIAGFFALLFLIVGGGWWYVGTTSFADLVRLRIERTLEARMDREVTIRSVEVVRSRPQKVIVHDLRIANAPGGAAPAFATVRRIEITGGIESFWGRRIRVGRVDIVDPRLNFEVFPEGAPLTHNFPRWRPGPRSRYEVYHLSLGTMTVRGGTFHFLDRRHDIEAAAANIGAEVRVTSAEDLYQGTMSSPVVRMRIRDYEPFDVTMRGGFRYTPGVLALQSVALRGRGIETFLSGRLAPLTEGAYELDVTSKLALDRVREIFRVEKALEGSIALDGTLKGRQGDYVLRGRWSAPRVVADVYELAALRGALAVTNEGTTVDVESARYGGGTLSAHYALPKYEEPYPMSVDLRYGGVSVEKLFADWGMTKTGLRGAATGRLIHRWNKDDLLGGSGSGSARLAKNATAFSDARYPIVLAGETAFDLDRGVITFRRAALKTDASDVSFTGTLRIEDLRSDLAVRIVSRDLSELDRLGFNIAQSAGKSDYELLGMGGSGTITGTLRGTLGEPVVAAGIAASGAKFNHSLLGEANLALRYDGPRSLLTFERANFLSGGGRLSMTGTLTFPDRGPSPRFDLAIEAAGYDVASALGVVDLPFGGIRGVAGGKLFLAGTPEEGRARFDGLTIVQGSAELRLRGTTAWAAGEGNVSFDLDIAARSFPVADILAFLDLGTLPVTGELTGTLHIEGPKSRLEGAGSVAVRQGTIMGEPVDLATADIAFIEGRMRATSVAVSSPAGRITGEAEFDLTTERFSYTIATSTIDVTRLKLLEPMRSLFGGNVTITSSGAGTFEQPELVVEAVWHEAALSGVAFPDDAPPPQLYLAIRNGQLIVRGSAAGVVTIEGSGSVGPDLAIDGRVTVAVSDIGRFVRLLPATATLPAAGNFVVELRLGGRLTPLDALRVDGTVPVLNLVVSEHQFTAPQPLRFGLRDGRITFDQFELQREGTSFSVHGSAAITGQKELNVTLLGNVEAALLQLFVRGLRADGHINVTAAFRGTLANPILTGGAEFLDARLRFPGFPQLLDDVNGTIVFLGRRIAVEGLRATVGDGRIVAGGSIDVDGLRPRRVNLLLEGTNVAIRYYEGLTIVADFDLQLTGDAERMQLQSLGPITVSSATFSRDIDISTAILNAVLLRRAVTPIVAATWQDRVTLKLQIAADGTLAVRNNLAEVTGSADLDVGGTLGNPVILGDVELDEGGRVTFQNIDYRLVRGTINFQNPFRIDPYFDITLEGRVSGAFSEVESGPIDVTVNLTGTLDRFTPTITSDPPASDITLFSLVGFGAIARGSGQQATNVALFGQSLLQQSLLSLLGSQILPFADSFTYDPGLLDTSADPGPKVTFEKRISNNLRLLVIYHLQDHRNRALIEWQVSPDWTLQFLRDEIRKEWRTEARFRRRYAAHWSFGREGDRAVTLAAATQPLQGSIAETHGEVPPVPLPPTGPPVARIDYRSDAPFDTALLSQYLAIRTGEPMSKRAVQSSIKNLFATGDFRDIRVDAAPAADGSGVVVTFILSLNYRISEIRFEGLEGSARERAQREVTVRVGEVLSLDAVDDSARIVQEFLARNGYLEAAVDPETRFFRPTSRAEVIFHVDAGPRARIAGVRIEGDVAPFTPEQIIEQMKNGPGDFFRIRDARDDAERMRTFMVRRDHRRATVRFLGHVYDAGHDSVTLRYAADAGPIVRVEVTGVPRSAVRRLIPFRRSQPYSEDAIDAAADRIIEHYQRRGHFNVAVDTESRLEANRWTTTFHVEPGPRYRLTAVAFTGNQQVGDRELQKVISTSTRGGFRTLVARLFRRPAGPTAGQLSDDRDAIESYYRLQGFSEATVAAPLVATHPDGTMTVTFPVNEGPQTRVTEVTIEGNEDIPASDLPRLQLDAGEPLNPQTLREDLVALQTFYGDRGYAEVQVTPRPVISDDKRSAKVTYVIAEGPKTRIADVVVRGNTYTRGDVVLRKSMLDEGEPFSYAAILEAQRNLYRLGIFQRVDVQWEQAGTSLSDRNVTIHVEEGKNLTVAGAAGATKREDEKLSPLLSASIAHRNLLGTGRYLGLEVLASREREEAFLTYREPFIFNYDIPVQLTVFQSDERRRGAHLVQRGTFIEATKIARFQTRWSARYEYKIGDCVIENPNDPDDLCAQAALGILPGVDRALTNIRISSVTPTFFWDKRDDAIDPHRGFFTSASIEYAFPMLSADARFLKEFAQATYYLPLSERTVFVVSGRAGLIHPLGGRTVPLSERFTAGGESSHRAFPLDLLGTLCADPSETNGCRPTLIRTPGDGRILPIGGNGLLVTNLEYRFPIVSTLGGALFVDAGNVYRDTTIDFGDLRYGAGAGIRYLSPVGPLRIDVGYKLNRRIIGVDAEGRRLREKPFAYFITLGYAF